jgi:hypothetical protein
MRKTKVLMVIFPKSFSLLISVSASVQAEAFACTYAAGMPLTSAKGLAGGVKE